MWAEAVDPMEQAEEEMRRKEESERRDLLQTLSLDEFYFSCRDLTNKGKDVQPTGKQRKAVQLLAQSVKFGSSVRRWTAASLVGLDSGSFSFESAATGPSIAGTDPNTRINLMDKPRIFINSSPVCKIEQESSGRRKLLKRFLMLFNDVLLILTNGKKESADTYEVEQVLWAENLRIRHVFCPVSKHAEISEVTNTTATTATAAAAEDEARRSFELILCAAREGAAETSTRIVCEDEDLKMLWLSDFEAMLLGYHLQTERSKKIGWFHDIIRGTFHSAAYRGDMALLRKYLRALQDRIDHGMSAAAVSTSHTYNNNSSSSNSISNSNSNSNNYHSNGGNGGGGSRCSIGGNIGGSVKNKTRLSPPQLLRAQHFPMSIDAADLSGMTAMHWAVLKQHEMCARLLLDRGADVDALQRGGNTPLLLAAITGSETMVRLLVEQGADLYARNSREYDAVFMSVLYGHNSRGLPWLLQLLTSKGLQLNEIDSNGATPLHLCAKKNLSRPVRMLVDYGADVNVKHITLKLTPLHMACSHPQPDVETIRSLLDNGAFPNWRDVNGLSAFDVVLQTQQNEQRKLREQQTNYGLGGAMVSLREIIDTASADSSSIAGAAAGGNGDGTDDGESDTVLSTLSGGAGAEQFTAAAVAAVDAGDFINNNNSNNNNNNNNNSNSSSIRSQSARWRAMEGTLQQVGDWAVRALPALLEISKRGGRCFRPEREFSALRPSFRAAVEEAQCIWHRQQMPRNFMEFVLAREQAGEELRLHKTQWAKDRSESVCQLCSCSFSIRNRRHHCRSCGILTCDDCASKRLLLHSADFRHLFSSSSSSSAIAAAIAAGGSGSSGNSPLPWDNNSSPETPSSSSRHTISALGGSSSEKQKQQQQQQKDELRWQRVCDGCFNRLCYEASQPSADHYRVKQLKRCAMDVMHMMEDLIEALDDPSGDPNCVNASLRETMQLMRGFDAIVGSSNSNSNSNNFNGSSSGKHQLGAAAAAAVAAADAEQQKSTSNRLSGLFRSSMSMKSPPLQHNSSSSGFRSSLMGPATSAELSALLAGVDTSPLSPQQQQQQQLLQQQKKSLRFGNSDVAETAPVIRSGEQLVEALKLRDEKLTKAENFIAKFLEAADGYHKVTKKLIEKKIAANRLWSAGRDESARFDE